MKDVSYDVVKETALVLVDVCHNPELVEEIRKIVERNADVRVRDVLLRRASSQIHSEVQIEVEGTMAVGELDQIKSSIESSVMETFGHIRRVVISAKGYPA